MRWWLVCRASDWFRHLCDDIRDGPGFQLGCSLKDHGAYSVLVSVLLRSRYSVDLCPSRLPSRTEYFATIQEIHRPIDDPLSNHCE